MASVLVLACDAKDSASTPDAKAASSDNAANRGDPKADAKPPAAGGDEAAAAEAGDDAPPAADAALPGPVYLVGTVEVPGAPMAFQAKLDASEPPSGTISIPMQGGYDLPLRGVKVSASELAFALENGATWSATIGDDGTLACAFGQGGAKLSCEMKKVDEAAFAAAGPQRPQTPKPPYPYETQDIEWDAARGVHLAGTITRPKGAGPHPAVVLVSGSGQQDRDESILGHKPFAVLADRLARAGVATLRYDDRGAGKSTGDVEGLTITKEAEDAASALDQLRAAEGIDPGRAGVLGHSVGGLIAPMLASKRPDDVAFVVLVAGPGVQGTRMHARQVQALLEAHEAPAEAIEASKKSNEAMYAVVEKGGDLEEIKKVLQTAGLTGPALEAQAAMVASPWFREFLTMDPVPALKQTKCPVLAVGGSLDLQVVSEQNIPAIAAALKAGGNDHVSTRTFEGLNHLLQPAKTGTPDEYGQIETTMDETALAEIESWIVAQTKL